MVYYQETQLARKLRVVLRVEYKNNDLVRVKKYYANHDSRTGHDLHKAYVSVRGQFNARKASRCTKLYETLST